MAETGATGRDPEERRIGSVLRERYRIAGVIGAGGMATVYLAVHRNGNRVALKMLHPELGRQAAHRERFVREAYVANSLEHPGAVQVLDDDVADDGSPFLVMELLRGETLAGRLRRGGPLAAREVLALAYALCDVLARAHAIGVVHRDIKPDNLFLTTRGELKVLDFGIARVRQEGRDSGTRTGHMLGTPAFMPPEQALGRRHAIDGRSDLWAAGATMFAALTGRPPHQGEAPEELLVRSATEPAPGLATVAPEVSPAIAAVVDRALAFAPERRFADAAAMQAAIAAAHLEAFGAGVEATPLPRGEADAIVEGMATTDTLPSGPDHARTQAASSVRAPPTPLLGVDALGPTRFAERPATLNGAAPESSATPAAPRRRRTIAALAGLLVVGGALGLWRATAGCATNADCAGGEGPAICRAEQRRCVPLASERCRVIADEAAVSRDDTLWVGAMYPLGDRTSSFGVEGGRLVELARRDFVDLIGGLPPARAGGSPRPIGVILCDDADDYEAIAAHLVDDVGVPAVLGFGRSKEALDLASRHFVPKGVLALASNPAAMLSSIPHPPGEVRLVYRVTTSTEMRVPPQVALLRQAIEPELRAAGGAIGPEGPLRVAILQSSSASGTSLNDALIGELAATRRGDRDEVRTFKVADDADDAAPLERAAAEVARFAPHVVFAAGSPTRMLGDVERAWGEAPRPEYVVGSMEFATALALARERAGFAGRFHMITNLDNPTHVKVRAHYLANYGGDAGEFSPTPYDAFYVLAYAAVAAGDAPLTGRTLARAIARLGPPGATIEVGPADIYPALKALARGDNIDLRGTRTSLDFDPETGDATADFAVSCIDVAAGRMREAAGRFDARTRRYEAPARCR
ncbi:MAG: protein kinase [Myxococcales bacterium]|nr:protein kinase [Myxococcales bacterium]